ncbi:pseudouridine synthase [Bradyrhizobium sediminis]|uniref:Pseudouridine synthase n=1 Tax=Bradyrhizobium sediminis TaxID=2840469 RepID=A0A975NN51_9BRAD|nr:pseudouridine synthase [Bradyrhizobium sediminis]QWG17606.1 pseudouridine synthase [Bradyrhizobium sediminis]
MPRDNDKNNDSRGRRDRPSGGKGRSGAARGPEKKFAKRGFAGKSEGERRPYAGKSDGEKSYGKKPYAGAGKPYAGKRDGDAPRRDYGDAPRPRGDRPFGDRPQRFNRDDRPRSDDRGGEKRPYTPRSERGDARPAGRFSDRKFGDKKPYTPREGGGEKRPYTPRGDRPQGDRPYSARPSRDGDRPRGDRPERKFGGDKKFSRGAPRDRHSGPGDRGPRKDFGDRPAHGESKPWQKRDASSPDHAGRNSRPPRDGARNFDRPKFDKPRYDKPREDRGGDERPRFSRPREDRPHGDRPQGDRPFRERPKFDRPREDRPKFDRPRRDREGGSSWQEHPRSETSGERPRRDNEDDSKVFAKRPAFGGRGAYRERKPEFEKRAARPPREKKSGERIAKVLSRAGLASRRDAEEWIVQGRVTVNGRIINSPALDVTANDVITVDGKPLPPRERTRLFLYHKPRGLMTTHADPEGRPTVFDHLPEGLPRLISIGRLDFNTEGLLLLTNDGGLARALELPDTGWLRRYRVRAHGEVTQAQLDELKKGVEVDGVKYGPIDATLERDQGANVWLVFAIREGKNREVRNVMAHLGLEVNRLIRVSYGPFQLGELEEGQVEEVKTRVLREQLGEKIAELAGADFNRPMPGEAIEDAGGDSAPRGKKPFKPAGKSALIADRKGRRVLVQRTGSEEARARNEEEASGYGPPRRPKRGYHGKRDIKPLDE